MNEKARYNEFVNKGFLSDERRQMLTDKYTSLVFYVAIYIRISKEDERAGESESVTNQKELLTDYVKKFGYNLANIYIDDGFTGTNFERPAFQKMLKDIELGKINMVITKDLSRLGRDYIETGHYIERYFPMKRVRYVALTDNIDTFLENDSNNDIAPFKSILNDMYAKDLSKKIRTSLRTMQMQGKWVGGCPPFGYRVDPDNKNHLVVDDIEAPIVKKIYDMFLNGVTPNKIANTLNIEKVPTFFITRNREMNRKNYKVNGLWDSSTIKKMLRNQLYTGDMVQNRRQRVNYKYRKIIVNKKDNWIIVENTHEAIIDEEIFNKIQKLIPTCPRNDKKVFRLFDGLLYCYECGHKIGIRNKDKKGVSYMCCNYYRKNVKLKVCTSHGFNYDRLEASLLNQIQKMFSSLNQNGIIKELENYTNKLLNENDIPKEIDKYNIALNNLKERLDKMYLDKLDNNIDIIMYNRISTKLNEEIKETEIKLEELKDKLNNNSNIETINLIKNIVKDFLNLKSPSRELILKLFNKIEIHQDKTVDVTFNFKELNYFYENDITY